MSDQRDGTTPAVDTRPTSRVPTGWLELAVIAAGGIIGTLARYGLNLAWPHEPGRFAWATLAVNTSGCLLIGGLMVLIDRVWIGRPLVRPFLGIGVLGGYTTFSTYALDIQQMLDAGAAGPAVAYLVGTVAAALAAVWVGTALTTRVWYATTEHTSKDNRT